MKIVTVFLVQLFWFKQAYVAVLFYLTKTKTEMHYDFGN